MDALHPFGLSIWTVFGFYHLVMAVALWKMVQRTNEGEAWHAIVPLLNVALFLRLARKPLWWIVLFFIPLVNLAALIAATMSLCERFGTDKWLGIAAVFSPFNLLLYLYLAFATQTASVPGPVPSEHPAARL